MKEDYHSIALDWLLNHGFITLEEHTNRRSERLKSVLLYSYNLHLYFYDDIHMVLRLYSDTVEVRDLEITVDGKTLFYDSNGNEME